MKYRILFIAMALVVLSVSLALSQEDIKSIKNDALPTHQRAPALFPHAKHAKIIFCNQCHHDYDQYGNNKVKDEGDVTGQSCAECHGKAPTATNPTPILTAYHGKCKGCHERMEVHGKKSGPVMCGSCHTK
ncbi:MAG TPA: hypothetical protein DCE18_05615 [Syntrophobacteraceae bacterium]|nr:hypothetical protein [Syntrophobacteraceae bacterium]